MKTKILFFLCLIANPGYSQITTNEKPPSLSDLESIRQYPKNIITLSTPDLQKITKEDQVNDQLPMPLRYAYPVVVNYTRKL
ncbi:MAG: hypothetical protein LBS01_11310 [Prevotellaceae bacterium]|jgi:hypothetical protein|nr:hypothetical protein [Prevotellaceae bacterium]